MGVGNNIKVVMENKKIRISELAEESGVPYGTLHAIIARDSNNIQVETLNKIATALGTDIYALTGTHPPLDYERDFTLKDSLFRRIVERISIEEKDALMSGLIAALDQTTDIDEHFNTNEYTHRLSKLIEQYGLLLWSARRGDKDSSFEHLANLNIILTEHIKKVKELLLSKPIK